MTAIDVAHLKTWIGRTAQAQDIVTPRLIDGFRATFDPHLAPVPAGNAPLALHWCLAPPAAPMAELGPDGHPARGGFLPPVPLPRRMWAGGSIETLGPLKSGDAVTRTSRVADLSLKEGRSGTLCFINVDYEFATPHGVAIRERHDIVYRDIPSGRAQPAAKAAPAEVRRGDVIWGIQADPVLLFRYSALTFNGHRIHYDYPYVTDVEGYAGLVVHGPLQASLLFNLAATIGGAAPRKFDYRGLSPLIAGQRFEVHGRRNADGTAECWTQDSFGVINMQGSASW
jgi:3-methylfumaryl-CoA hydratase